MCAYTVYKHTSPSGKVYIGITCRKPEYRWNNGKAYKRSTMFYRAIQKYGWDNIKHEILFEGLTKEEACAKEQELIKSYHSMDSRYGYNLTSGGEMCEVSDETRRKMSEQRKGVPKSESHRKHISEGQRGKVIPLESRLKMSESHKTRVGWHHSEETKRKIAEANRGKPKPYATKKVSQYTIDGELISEYPSIAEASRSVGVYSSGISACLKGINRTCGGYVWKYAD